MKKTLLLLTFVVIVVVALAELCLRVTGKCRVYSETNLGKYVSGFGELRNSWYYTYPPQIIFTPTKSEYSYRYQINDWGLREREIDTPKNEAVWRILVFGDSFAEGLGAPYDSTWPRLLEKDMAVRGKKVEVINAGVAGSDLFYAYVHYRDKLRELKPDIILVSMNASDYSDYIFRGGMERFKENGKVHGKAAPWNEPLYRYSHFYRALVLRFRNYTHTGILMSQTDFFEECRQANHVFHSLLEDFKARAENDGSAFAFFTHCNPTEIIWSEAELSVHTRKNLSAHSGMFRDNGAVSFDISNELIKHFKGVPEVNYSYTKDRHYNAIGYNCMAQIIADSLCSLPIFQVPRPGTDYNVLAKN